MSSNNVDNRVVNMQFNNSQFEAGVSKTISSLNSLKESLQFNNATSGIESVQSAVSSLSFGNIESSLASLESRFSTLGVVGMTAISNITTSVMNLGTQIASTLTNQIIEGGTTRYQNIADAKFTIEGLGKDWEALYEDMDYAVSGTAYGIDEAAKAASSLSASGIEAGEDMKTALRGISGVAAMTNSDYSTMADIFTTVAGQGKLMTQQLRQFESRGLNVAATLADYLGTTEASVRDMVTSGEIDFEIFSNAMDDAFGEHATKANETFSGALSNMKASLSRIGENFARPIYERLIGPLNDLRELFDKVKNKLTDFTGTLTGGDWYNSPLGTFVGALSNKVRTLIQNVDLSWLDTFVYYLNEAADAGTYFITEYDGVINTIKNYLTETGKVTDENSAVMKILTSLSNVGQAIKNVFNSVSIIFQTLVSAFKEVFNLGDTSDSLLSFSEVLLKISEAMTVTEEDASKIRPIFVDVFETIKKVIDGIISFASTLSGYLGPIFSTLFNYMLKFYHIGCDVINTIVSMVKESKIVSGILDIVNKSFEKSTTIVGAFQKTFSGLTDFLKKISPKTWGLAALVVILVNLVKKFSAFGFAIKRVTALANNVATFGNTFSNIFKGLAYYTRSIAIVAVLKELAIAIAVLAASLALLTLVDSDKLVTATECMAAIIGIMAVFGIVITKMTSKIGNVVKVSLYMASLSTMFLALSISTLLLVVALSKLASIDTTNIWKNFAVLSALLAELVVAAIILSKFAPKMSKGAFALVFYAAAVYILVAALEKLTQVNTEGIGSKLVALGVCMLALVGVAKIANSVSISAPIGILAMIASIWLIEKMLKYIINEGVDFDDVKNNIDKLAIALGSFILVAVILKVLASKSKGMLTLTASILLIATSIYIISSAIKKLADVDNPTALASAVRALIVVFVGIIALLTVLSKGGSVVKRAGSTILLISVAILIIASALKMLSSIKETDKMFAGLLAIVLSLVSVLAVMIIMSETVKKVKVVSLLTMAILIGVISLSLTLLTTIGDTSKMLKAAGGIAVVLLAITACMILVSRLTKFFNVTAITSLYGMILLLLSISSSILMLSSIGDTGKMYDAVASISLVLAVICAAIIAVSRYSKSMSANSILVLGVMVESLLVIAGSLVLLTQYGDMDKVYDAVMAISLVLAVLSLCFISISAFGYGFDVTTVVALGVAILSLLVIAASLRLLLAGGYDWEQMRSAVKAMIIVLGSVAVALSLLAVVSKVTNGVFMLIAAASMIGILLALSVAMGSFAKLVDTLVASLTQLTKIKYDKIDLGVLQKLVLLLAELGVVASLTGLGFVLLGAGLIATGLGLTIITVNFAIIIGLISKLIQVIDAFVKTITMVALMAPAIEVGVKSVGKAIVTVLTAIGTGLAYGISNFLSVLAKKAPEIKSSITTILQAIIETVNDSINTIVKYCLQGLLDFLTIVDEYSPSITEKVLSIIVTILQGIASYSTIFGYYGAVIAVGFVTGLIAGITEMIDPLVATLQDLAIELVLAFSETMDSAGKVAADSLKVSLLSGTKATGDFFNELTGKEIFDTETVQGEIDYQREKLKENMKKTGEETADAEADSYNEQITERSDDMNNATQSAVGNATNQKSTASKNGKDTANASVNSYNSAVSSGSGSMSSRWTDTLNSITGDVDLSSMFGLGGDSTNALFSGMTSEASTQETKYKISELSSQAIDQMKKDGWYESGEYLVKDVQSGIDNSGGWDLSSMFTSSTEGLYSSADDTTEEMGVKGTESASNYWDAYINTTYSKEGDVTDAMSSVASAAADSADDSLEIKSPSRRAIKTATFYNLGLVEGLKNTANLVAKAAISVASTITNSVDLAFDQAQKYSNGLTLSPTITPVIDSSSFNNSMVDINGALDNSSSVRLATSSAISLNDANAFTINDRLDALSQSIDKLANTDYSKLLEGVNINVDASTNVDGTPLKRMSSAFTIQQIDDTQNGLIMAAGGRV